MKKLNKNFIYLVGKEFVKNARFNFSLIKNSSFNFSNVNLSKNFYSSNKFTFANKLPSHQKLKMPTLSPTMVKVQLFINEGEYY